MGWSATQLAVEMLERIFKLNNKEGTIEYNGDRFFLEPSHQEYVNGKIKVDVLLILKISKTKDGLLSYRYEQIGSFYINPYGEISKSAKNKYPFLKLIDY